MKKWTNGLKSPPKTTVFALDDLTEPHVFKPTALQPSAKKNDTNALVLCLAVIFNDLKGLIYFWHHIGLQKRSLLGQKTPQNGSPSKVDGQITGMEGQVLKMLVSFIHETWKAIRENSQAINSDDFQEAIASLHKKSRKKWDELYRISTHHEHKLLRNAFEEIRDSISSHYFQPKALSQGYAEHFSGTTPERSHIYLSYGPDMVKTRYYFADAAVMAQMRKAFTKRGLPTNLSDQIVKHADTINTALAPLVGKFIEQKTSET